jgi:hypothetical protein
MEMRRWLALFLRYRALGVISHSLWLMLEPAHRPALPCHEWVTLTLNLLAYLSLATPINSFY